MLKTYRPASAILRAAFDPFYRCGIQAMDVDRVIAESNVAEATFYRQFRSKDDLVVAYVERRQEAVLLWLQRYVDNGDGDPGRPALEPVRCL